MSPEHWADLTFGNKERLWPRMSPEQKAQVLDKSSLSPQLIGLEGWRVEVVDADGHKERFIVSRSSGWIPCHIKLKTAKSSGGFPADRLRPYQSVRKLYQAYRDPWVR